MKKLLASVLCAALALTMQPITVVAAGLAAQNTGSVSGTAKDKAGTVLSGVKVQLRNVDTGSLVGTTISASNGAFSFTGLAQGNYVIEIVDDNGKIIGVSAAIAVGAGAVIAGLTVAASSAGALAGAAAAGGLGAFFTSTGGILVLAGVGIGATAAIVAVTNDASPSGG